MCKLRRQFKTKTLELFDIRANARLRKHAQFWLVRNVLVTRHSIKVWIIVVLLVVCRCVSSLIVAANHEDLQQVDFKSKVRNSLDSVDRSIFSLLYIHRLFLVGAKNT